MIDHDRVRELLNTLIELQDDARDQMLRDLEKSDPDLHAEITSLLPFTCGDREDIQRDRFIGEVVGHFTIIERIGSGGMGRVYRARQNNPPRDVALKILRSSLLARSAAKRFEIECRLLGRLKHGGIAQIYEAGSHMLHNDHIPWIAMELIENATPLTRYVQENNLTLKDTLSLFKQVCQGVSEAHRHGVIHRDLKPANILVNGDGKPKVIDFGVAMAVDPHGLPTALRSMARDLVGTMQYMSPEQASGKDVDISTDVYSLGVILYELLSGERPYDLDSTTLPHAIEMITHADPPPLRTKIRSLSSDVEIVVQHAMAVDPEKRYRSAVEFHDDIECLISGDPITARVEPRFIRFLRKRRRIAAMLLILIPIFSAITIVASYYTIKANHELDQKTKLLEFAKDALLINKEVIRSNPEYWNTHFELNIQKAQQIAPDDPSLQAELLNILFSSADIANEKYDVYTSLRLTAADLLGTETEQGTLFVIEYAAYEETVKRLGNTALINDHIAWIDTLRLSIDNPSANFRTKALTAQAYIELGVVNTDFQATGQRHSIEAAQIVREELGNDFTLLAPIIRNRAWGYIFHDEENQDAPQEALELLDPSLIQSFIKTYGDFHLQTLAIKHLRCIALGDSGFIDEKLQELRPLSKTVVERYGVGHNATWQILNSFAIALVAKANEDSTTQASANTMKLQAAAIWNELIRQSSSLDLKSNRDWYVDTFRDFLPEFAPSKETLLRWQETVDLGPTKLSPQIDFRSAFDDPHSG